MRIGIRIGTLIGVLIGALIGTAIGLATVIAIGIATSTKENTKACAYACAYVCCVTRESLEWYRDMEAYMHGKHEDAGGIGDKQKFTEGLCISKLQELSNELRGHELHFDLRGRLQGWLKEHCITGKPPPGTLFIEVDWMETRLL